MVENDDRLREVEKQLERVLVLLESLTNDVRNLSIREAESSNRTLRTMHGDGNSRGLLVRLDRLEQAQERQRWLTRTLAGAVIALGARAVVGFLTTH